MSNIDQTSSMFDPCLITAAYKLAQQILLNTVLAGGKPDVGMCFALAEEFESYAVKLGHIRDVPPGGDEKARTT